MKTISEKTLGAGSLLGGAFVVSTFGIWARFVSPMLSPVAQTITRCLLAAGIMAAVILFGRKKVQLRGHARKQYLQITALGLLTFGLALLFTLSVTTTKVGNTFSLIYAGSILTSFIVGVFFLSEKTSLLKIGAVVIALAGLAMYGFDPMGGLSVGILAGFGAGICDGLSNVVRKQLRGMNRELVVTCQYAIAGVCTVPLIFFVSGPHVHVVSIGAVIAMILYAVASLVFGKLLLHGFSHFDVNVGGVILAIQIFFGMLLGFIFFHETPSPNELAGSVLLFLAVVAAMASGGKLFDLARNK